MDRRRSQRIEALLDQEEQVLIEDNFQYVACTIVNFSEGGALLALKDPEVHLQIGDTFALFFDNGGHVLPLKAVALRKIGRRIAFQFSGLTPDEEKAIHTKIIRMEMVLARVGAV